MKSKGKGEKKSQDEGIYNHYGRGKGEISGYGAFEHLADLERE